MSGKSKSSRRPKEAKNAFVDCRQDSDCQRPLQCHPQQNKCSWKYTIPYGDNGYQNQYVYADQFSSLSQDIQWDRALTRALTHSHSQSQHLFASSKTTPGLFYEVIVQNEQPQNAHPYRIEVLDLRSFLPDRLSERTMNEKWPITTEFIDWILQRANMNPDFDEFIQNVVQYNEEKQIAESKELKQSTKKLNKSQEEEEEEQLIQELYLGVTRPKKIKSESIISRPLQSSSSTSPLSWIDGFNQRIWNHMLTEEEKSRYDRQ